MVYKNKNIPWNKGTVRLCKPNETSFKKGRIPKNKGKIKLYMRKCPNCNEIFYTKQHYVNFCSRTCHTNFYRGISKPKSLSTIEKTSNTKKINGSARGHKNPNWQGGLQKQKQPRNVLEYRKWRLEIFKRDNFTCQLCDKNSYEIKIIAHHKKQVALYPELIYNINNGITLCVNCHKRIHKNDKKFKRN